MPCITLFVPGLKPEDRTPHKSGVGFTHNIALIENGIQQAAFDSVSALADNKLTLEDFWVYVIPVHRAPATKITIELIEKVERNQAWLQALAGNVGRVAAQSCEKYSDHVVVFTYEQNPVRGFCEIGGH